MAADDSPETQEAAVEAALGWKEFLESIPPESEVVSVATDFKKTYSGNITYYNLENIPIQLYCDATDCESIMWFDWTAGNISARLGIWASQILRYTCRHCKHGWKVFAVYVKPLAETAVAAAKIGEYPPFGPPVPSRVISLVGGDRELFLRGRRAENHGLGIGAFAYYRRVVENQKNRIIGEIIKVAKKVGAKTEVIDALNAAMKENQFTKAVDSIKVALPESLLIDGHNPLKLLHSALSKGMHEQAESNCLGLAESIRLVLTDLAERIDAALKEQAELKSALSRLLQSKSEK